MERQGQRRRAFAVLGAMVLACGCTSQPVVEARQTVGAVIAATPDIPPTLAPTRIPTLAVVVPTRPPVPPPTALPVPPTTVPVERVQPVADVPAPVLAPTVALPPRQAPPAAPTAAVQYACGRVALTVGSQATVTNYPFMAVDGKGSALARDMGAAVGNTDPFTATNLAKHLFDNSVYNVQSGATALILDPPGQYGVHVQMLSGKHQGAKGSMARKSFC